MNNLTKILWVIFIVDLLLLLINWRTWNGRQKSDELVVGIFCAGHPYASVNLDGNLEGFDVELAHKFAQKLGKKIIFKDMQFDLLHSALKMEHINVIGFSFVMTKKKLQAMDMIDVYGKPKAEMTFIFWRQIPENIQTIENLKKQSLNKPIAVKAETAFADVLEELGITNVMALEQYQDLVLPIKYGQALAVAVGPRYALVLQKQYPEIKILKIKLDKPWGEGVGLGVKKGNIELKEKLEKAVKELKEDGTIAALKLKWFGEGAQ